MRIGSITGILLLPLLAGCVERRVPKEVLRIEMGELLRNPDVYAGKEVRLSGMYFPGGGAKENCFRLLPFSASVWDARGGASGVEVCPKRPLNTAIRSYESLEVRGQVQFEEGVHFRITRGEVSRRGDPLFQVEALALMVSGLAQKEPRVARKKLGRALRGTLSPAARYHVHMKLGALCGKAGAYGEALRHYQRADDYTRREAEKEAARAGYRRNFRLEEKRRHIDEIGEED